MREKTSVTALAKITGILAVNKPNKSHNNVPKAKREYIGNERPEVSFVLIVFTACGKKELVVLTAAAKPKIVMLFNYYAITFVCGEITGYFGGLNTLTIN